MTNQFEFDKVTATKYLGKTEDEKHIFSGYANAVNKLSGLHRHILILYVGMVYW